MQKWREEMVARYSADVKVLCDLALGFESGSREERALIRAIGMLIRRVEDISGCEYGSFQGFGLVGWDCK